MPACAWSLARIRPADGLRLVNRYRLANRWPWRSTLRQLADRSSFARNLTEVAGRITDPPPPVNEPDFGWVFAPRMPAWATPDAVAAVRDLLTTAAERTPEPLDADRARHQALSSLVFEGNTVRQVNTAVAAPAWSGRRRSSTTGSSRRPSPPGSTSAWPPDGSSRC